MSGGEDFSPIEQIVASFLVVAVIFAAVMAGRGIGLAHARAGVCAVQCPDAPKSEFRDGRCVCFEEAKP